MRQDDRRITGGGQPVGGIGRRDNKHNVRKDGVATVAVGGEVIDNLGGDRGVSGRMEDNTVRRGKTKDIL